MKTYMHLCQLSKRNPLNIYQSGKCSEQTLWANSKHVYSVQHIISKSFKFLKYLVKELSDWSRIIRVCLHFITCSSLLSSTAMKALFRTDIRSKVQEQLFR
jgi:hypothetical protein